MIGFEVDCEKDTERLKNKSGTTEWTLEETADWTNTKDWTDLFKTSPFQEKEDVPIGKFIDWLFHVDEEKKAEEEVVS